MRSTIPSHNLPDDIIFSIFFNSTGRCLSRRTRSTIPSHDLPYDIIFLIFSKSTVKSLVRFTSISKSINAMIRSSTFIATHRHNQIHDNNSNANDTHLVYMPNDDCEALRIEIDRVLLQKYHKQCNLPFRSFSLIGACEGLICLMKDSDVYIFNPCVGSMKTVPPSGSRNDNADYLFYFTERSCDHKVIKHVFIESYSSLIIMEIYSLATDSWRRIEYQNSNFWYLISIHYFFNRFIYWRGLLLSNPDAGTVFVRFDMDEEIFEETTKSFPRTNVKCISERGIRWHGVFEGNPNRSAFVLYHSRKFGYFRPQDYYLVPVKETLMLFDQKDKNDESWIWYNIPRQLIERQIKDESLVN